MSVLYHLTIPRPARPMCEAVWQEIDVLRRRLGGDLVYLNPTRHAVLWVPRLLYGWHRLRELRRREVTVDLHHLYNPDPYPFPILRWLNRPIVYTLSAGLRGDKRPSVSFFDEQVHTLVVADEADRRRLAMWGLDNVRVIRPGIDVTRFTVSPLPLRDEFRLMVGSAPWVKGQFRSKGVYTLLDAAQSWPQLRLIFLWRGVLFDEMAAQVRQRGLEARVEILNRRVDVNAVLADVHASVTLASDPAIIRSFPRSLLESLAAGKPVLVSQGIPMAHVVARTGCGRVVTHVTPDAFIAALTALRQDYADACQQAAKVGRSEFSQERMIDAYRDLYRSVG
jgi:glycosyltransferase involved in cell wall biosynthesis